MFNTMCLHLEPLTVGMKPEAWWTEWMVVLFTGRGVQVWGHSPRLCEG